jgi:hypothetical protein
MTSAADVIAVAAQAALLQWLGRSTAPDAQLGTFLHASQVQAGIEANTVPMPLITLFDYTTNQKATNDRVLRADCTMYFCSEKAGQGDSAEVEMAAVAQMTQLKRRFLAALDSSPILEITNIRATPFHNAYAALLTGIGATFTLGVPASLVEPCLPALVESTRTTTYQKATYATFSYA